MGGGSYNSDARMFRSTSLSYDKVTTDDAAFKKNFQQQEKAKAHEAMSPLNARREARYSENHPNALPIILGLDVTASMGMLPKLLLVEGLPKIMSKLLQAGVDPALCFTAIGDHECDSYPFQIGQFEAGDEELDGWLTKTYLEAGGGGNAGESYLLAWFFAAFRTDTDAWDKNKKKGYIFTFGDEPCLPTLHLKRGDSGSAWNRVKNGLTDIFGTAENLERDYTAEELIKLASEKYHIYHINVQHGYRATTALDSGWRKLLGENAVDVSGFEPVADTIVGIIARNEKQHVPTSSTNPKPTSPVKPEEPLL